MAKFFSVDRRELYQVGNLLQLAKVTRANFPELITFPQGCYSQDDLMQHLAALYPEGISFHGRDYLYGQHNFEVSTQGQGTMVKHEIVLEILLEFVRRASFPHRPSRFQSFFGWDSLDMAKAFRKDGQRVFQIECEDFFRADMELLTVSCQNASGSICAHKYWQGEATPDPKWEFLLIPPVTVIEQVA